MRMSGVISVAKNAQIIAERVTQSLKNLRGKILRDGYLVNTWIDESGAPAGKELDPSFRLTRPAAEAVPGAEQDGDGEERCCPGRWTVRVMPVVDGVTQTCEREENTEDGGQRPVMARSPRLAGRSKPGAGGWRDPAGVKYLFAIEHGSLHNCAAASSVNRGSSKCWLGGL